MSYIFRMGSQIQFGKHKGKYVSQVVEQDPFYFKWLAENLKGMRIKSDTRKALEVKGIKIR